MTLQPIEPQEAVEWYLQDKEQDCSQSTVKAHNYRLNHFVKWCDRNDIENINTLSGRDLHQFRNWRRNDGDLNNVTLHTQLGTLRVFLKWGEKIDAVTEGLYDKILMPNLENNENARDKKIEPETAFDIIDYLRKYKYASFKHVVFELMWHTAARLGAIHGLDLDDYHPQSAYIEFNHRPKTGTPLKNRNNGERPVALNDEMCKILNDYIDHNRIDVTDEKGREPMFTTKHGRAVKSIIRRHIYEITQPCFYTSNCPENRVLNDCAERINRDKAGGCPYNLNPHAIRRGSLTYHLLQDWSKEDTGERADVTPAVLDKHYDRRTDKEKLQQRRKNVKKL